MSRTEEEIANTAYRSTMYSAFLALLKDMSIEDIKWLMPRLVQFVEDEEKWRNRK